MPQYRGINVLQYECDRIEAYIASEKEEIRWIEDAQELYADGVRSSLIETHKSLISEQIPQLNEYKNKLDFFVESNDRDSSCVSDDPLEFLYQRFLQQCLPYFTKRIEAAYNNHYNSIISSDIVLFARTAKKIAIHNLHHYAIGYIIKEFLLEKQLQELRTLPKGLKSPECAVQQKYEYYEDRLQHCQEIGKLLNDLRSC